MVEKVKIGIVEDDEIIAQTIVHSLTKLGYEPLSPAYTFREGLELIENNEVDIFLLDINLNAEKTGIDLGKALREKNRKPFIYLTSETNKNTIDCAIETSPSAYLVKPFKKEDLYSAIEVSIMNSRNKTKLSLPTKSDAKSLFIKQKQAYVKLIVGEIKYIKSEHVYLLIYTKDEKSYLVRGSLKEFISKLDDSFIRIHKSYIVNKVFIESYSRLDLTLNNQKLPIGEKYFESFIKGIK